MEEGVVKEMWAHSHKSNNTNEAATSSSNNGPNLSQPGEDGERNQDHLQTFRIKTDFPAPPPRNISRQEVYLLTVTHLFKKGGQGEVREKNRRTNKVTRRNI